MNKEELKTQAEKYRVLYNSNMCTREEAKQYIQPYLDLLNEKSIIIAKKYNQKPQKITFSSFVR